MKRAFLGLFGMMFGAGIAIPAFLMRKTFSGADAVGASPLLFTLQVAGLLLLVGFPMLYWVLLPVLEDRRQEREEL